MAILVWPGYCLCLTVRGNDVGRIDKCINDSGQRRPFVQEHERMPFFVGASCVVASSGRSSDLPDARLMRLMRLITIFDLLSNAAAVAFLLSRQRTSQ